LQELCDLAQKGRARRVRITINSGSRCKAWNLAKGGAVRSRHLPQANGYTLAADWRLRDFSLREMFNLAQKIKVFRTGGIGFYFGEGAAFIHTDIDTSRAGPGRWAYLNGVLEEPEAVFLAAESAATTAGTPASTEV
jgi:uncharacterized protein YcbK (DUF882 family)